MRILIGMETSGELRRRFRALGHYCISVDMLPADDDGEGHFQGDVFDFIELGWDMGIFHPTCTFLTCSAEWAYKDPDFERYPGVGYHQRVKPGTLTGALRRAAREAAVRDVKRIMAAPIPRKAVENPRGHLSSAFRKPDQVIQPFEFGDDASKATCLWLENLPPLRKTHYVEPRIVNGKPRWANQTDSGQNRLSPCEDRWKERSKTYPGIADAVVNQWGALSVLAADNTGIFG